MLQISKNISSVAILNFIQICHIDVPVLVGSYLVILWPLLLEVSFMIDLPFTTNKAPMPLAKVWAKFLEPTI